MTTLDVVSSPVGRFGRGIDDPLQRGALVWEREETLFNGGPLRKRRAKPRNASQIPFEACVYDALSI